MTTTGRRELGAGRYLGLYRNEDGWEYCERVRGGLVVSIVARTAWDEIVLTRQFRPPSGGFVVELPSGTAEVHETAEVAARRELREETGFADGSWRSLGVGTTAPGLSADVVEMFVARDVVQASGGGGIADEEIEVLRVPVSRLAQSIDVWRSRDLVDWKVWLALAVVS